MGTGSTFGVFCLVLFFPPYSPEDDGEGAMNGLGEKEEKGLDKLKVCVPCTAVSHSLAQTHPVQCCTCSNFVLL